MTFREAMCLAAVRGGLNAFAFGQTLRELEHLGWKIVGPEATEKMVTAAMDADDAQPLSDWGKHIDLDEAGTFKVMLAASPSVDELLAEGERK